MKTKWFISVLAVCLTLGSSFAAQDESVAEARKIIKQFATKLKTELQKGMKAGGPVNAIGVCNEKAPKIAQAVSRSSGWTVARTSLKVRNPDNAPSAWEMKVLQEFEARKQAGADPKTLDYSEVVEINGQKVFRYMKAIPTGPVCLNCHGGQEVSPEVAAKIKTLYPTDTARGFKVGDIRGAFVLEKTF